MTKSHSSNIASLLLAAILLPGVALPAYSGGVGEKLGVSDKVAEEITSRTRGFTQAHITRNVEFINSCFVDDAQILGPDVHAVAGRSAINELNADWVDYGVWEFTETSTRIYGVDDLVIDEGTYSLNYGPDHVQENGKYINVWIRHDGEWKLYSNIWNRSPDN